MTMRVTAIYRFRAAPGKADELLAMLRQGRDFALSVDGCEAFEIQQGTSDPHEFAMLERWASPEAHLEHFDTNVKRSGVLDAAEALMTEPFPSPERSHFVMR